MTDMPPKLTREEIAVREVGRTSISRLQAAVLSGVFMLIICLVPLIDQALDALANEAGLRRPAIAEITRVFPDADFVRQAFHKQGLFGGALTVNSRLLEGLSRFESTIKDRSTLSNTLIPPMQRIVVGGFKAGTETVYCGTQDWLFYRPAVDSLTSKGFLESETLARRARLGNETTAPPQPHPSKAILEFHEFLRSRGIKLVVLPAPSKATVYAEYFSPRYTGTHPVQNASFAPWLEELQAAGVCVHDPAPALTAAKATTDEPLFLQRDTHWAPSGVDVAVDDLVRRLREDGLVFTGVPREYRREPYRVTHKGDIAAMLKYSGHSGYVQPETVVVNRVVDSHTGQPWRPEPSAEILVLGDSFTNIFSLEGMGWGTAGGFAAQLAAALQQPVDVIVRNDNGAHATRAELMRALAGNPDRLKNKRLIIWEFAARELCLGDWKTGLVDAGHSTASATDERLTANDEQSLLLHSELGHIRKTVDSCGGWSRWFEQLDSFHASIASKLVPPSAIITGEDGWLFHPLLTEFQTMPPTMEQYQSWSASYKQRFPDKWTPTLSSSVPSITDTAKQLSKEGIALLFVPIPQKAELYPEKISPDIPETLPASPQRYKVMHDLLMNDVLTLDLLPAFQQEKHNTEMTLPLYPKWDIHWRNRAVQVAAGEIAEAIRPLLEISGIAPSLSGLTTTTIASTCQTSLAKAAGYTGEEICPEEDILGTVLDSSGKQYDSADYPDAPVLIIGDTFMMGGNSGASLAAHLALELGTPVHGVYQQNGAQNVPEIFAREGRGLWGKRRVIVWYTISGMLGRHWKTVDFSNAGHVVSNESDNKQGRLRVRATLHALSPVPTPEDISPYTENLVIFEYKIERVIFGSCDYPVVYVAHWGVRGGKSVVATANARVGDTLELDLEHFDAHPELEGVNMADMVVSDFSLPLLFEVAGLANAGAEESGSSIPLQLARTRRAPATPPPAEKACRLASDAEAQARKASINSELTIVAEKIQSAGDITAWWGAQADFRRSAQILLQEKTPEYFWGDDGFLYVRNIDLPYCLAPTLGFAPEVQAVSQPQQHSPFDVVVNLNQQLRRRGIDLIVVPIPPRAEVDPEKMLQDENWTDWTHPGRMHFLHQLLQADVEVMDVLPTLRALKQEGLAASLKMESHFTPKAAEAVAKQLAEKLARYAFVAEETSKTSTTQEETTLDIRGVYVGRYREELGVDHVETLPARRVLKENGEPVGYNAESPILLIGDSYIGVFDKHNADIGSQLVAETGVAIDGQYSAGGGPRVPRDLAAMDANRLLNKRVVIWCFVSRYLVDAPSIRRDWGSAMAVLDDANDTSLMHQDDSTSQAVVVSSKREQLEVRAAVTGKSVVPHPEDIIPYRDNLSVFEYTIDHIDLGACAYPKIYVAHWGVIKGKSVDETHSAKIGDIHTLVLHKFDDHPELEGINISDNIVDDFSIPLLYATSNLSNPSFSEHAEIIPMDLGKSSGPETKGNDWASVYGIFTDSEIATRASCIDGDRNTIRAIVEQHGGWDAWKNKLTPYREALITYAREMEGPDLYFGSDNYLFSRQWDIYYSSSNFYESMHLGKLNPTGSDWSPTAITIAFNDYLNDRGVHLIVVPLPPRGEATPEYLTQGIPVPELAWCHPDRLRFIDSLLSAGVEAVDMLPQLLELKSKGIPISMKTDSHYTPLAANAAAEEIARRIQRYDFVQLFSNSDRYHIEEHRVFNKGSLCDLYAEQYENIALDKESITVCSVRDSLSDESASTDNSPIVIIGDSFSFIYNQYFSDFRSLLSAKLQIPVALHGGRAGGPRGPKMLLSEGSDLLKNRRVVIWYYVARYINPPGELNSVWQDNNFVQVLNAQQDTETNREEQDLASRRETRISTTRAAIDMIGHAESTGNDITAIYAQFKERLLELRDTTSQTFIELENGQLIGKNDLNYLFKVFLFEDGEGTPPAADALFENAYNTIVGFCQYLRERSIDLIVMPIPNKAEVYVDSIFDGQLPYNGVSPGRLAFIRRLLDADVEVVELYSDFRFANNNSLYIPTDIHWFSQAIDLAATRLSHILKDYSFVNNHDSGTFEIQSQVGTTRYPNGFYIRQESQDIQDAYNNKQTLLLTRFSSNNEYYKNIDDSPVLIIGDSFTHIFDYAGGELSAHIASKLGFALSRISKGGGGPIGPILFARQDEQLQKKRRVVIWAFVSDFLLSQQEQWKSSQRLWATKL